MPRKLQTSGTDIGGLMLWIARTISGSGEIPTLEKTNPKRDRGDLLNILTCSGSGWCQQISGKQLSVLCHDHLVSFHRQWHHHWCWMHLWCREAVHWSCVENFTGWICANIQTSVTTEAFVGRKSGDVATFDCEWNLMIGGSQIELREDSCSIQVVDEVIHYRIRVSLPLDGIVWHPHVHTQTNTSILFWGLPRGQKPMVLHLQLYRCLGVPDCWVILRPASEDEKEFNVPPVLLPWWFHQCGAELLHPSAFQCHGTSWETGGWTHLACW